MAHLGYLHTARLVVLFLWDLAKGMLDGWICKVYRGGRGRLSSLCHQWFPAGGALRHREGGSPARDGSIEAQR